MNKLKKSFSHTLITLGLASSLALISVSCSKDNKRKKRKSSNNTQAQTAKPNQNNTSAYNKQNRPKYAIERQTKIQGNRKEDIYTNNIDHSQIVIVDKRLSSHTHTYEYILRSPKCLGKEIHLKDLSKNNLCSNLKNDKLNNNCAKNNRDFVFGRLCRSTSYANYSWTCNSTINKKRSKNKVKVYKSTKNKKIDVNIQKNKSVKLTKKFSMGKRKGGIFKKKNKYDNLFYFDRVMGKTGFKIVPKNKKKNPIDISALASNEEITFAYKNEQIDMQIKCNTIHSDHKVPCTGYFKSAGNENFNINEESYFKRDDKSNGLSRSSDVYAFDFDYQADDSDLNAMKYFMTVKNIAQDTPELRFYKSLNEIDLQFEDANYQIFNNCKLNK